MTRAYDPWPVARTTLGGADLLVWRAAVEDESPTDDAAPGTVVRLKPAPIIQCGLGRLRLVEVQAAGRRRMAADEFFRGRRIAEGARLGT
jgi:methionyl-tRNA formyltransferase